MRSIIVLVLFAKVIEYTNDLNGWFIAATVVGLILDIYSIEKK